MVSRSVMEGDPSGRGNEAWKDGWDGKTQLGRPGSELWAATSPFVNMTGMPEGEEASDRYTREAATPTSARSPAGEAAWRDDLVARWAAGDLSVGGFGGGAGQAPRVITGGTAYGQKWGTAATGSGGSGGFSPSGGTAGQNDAYATLKGFLDQYGLGSMTGWAWQELLENRSANEIMLALLDRPEYKERFGKVIDARRTSGLPPVSAGEIVNYEDSWSQIARAGGLPSSFQGRDVAQSLMAQNVSAAEASDRVQRGYTQVAQAPVEVRAVFDAYFGAQGDAALAALFVDPDLALPDLERRVTEAQIGGAGAQRNFSIDEALAARLARQGVGWEQAQQQFGVLDAQRSLFAETVSENFDLTETAGIEGAFGLGSDEQMRRRAEARRASYSGGSGAAETATGLIGLGSARQT